MSYLEDLKKLCSEMQEVSNTKDEIDTTAKLSNIIEGLEAEQDQNLRQYNELKASYKDAVLHNSYGEKKAPEVTTGTTGINFEDFLKQFESQNK